MDISIVIVNWNVSDLLRQALTSIRIATGRLAVQTIVVDNHSRDNSVEMVRTNFPEVVLIANPDNKGFAGANNQGIALATGKYLFILNPDTELLPETLLTLFEYMEAHPDVAMSGPKLLNTDGSLQPSCRRFPSLWFLLSDHLFLSRVFPRSFFNGYMMGDFLFDSLREVDQPMGAAMFVRASVLPVVGLMDDHNFVWFDEVDWCFQFKKHGLKMVFNPAAVLTHHQGKSFRLWRNPFSGLVWLKSRHYFLTKNYSRLKAGLFVLVDATFYLLYLLLIIKLLGWLWGRMPC